jgi:hypothetical protein
MHWPAAIIALNIQMLGSSCAMLRRRSSKHDKDGPAHEASASGAVVSEGGQEAQEMNMRKLGRRLGSLGNKRKTTGGTKLVISQPNVPDAISEGKATKAWKYTGGLEFLAVGTSAKHGKFLLVSKGEKHVVLSARNLRRQPAEELERLEALDVDIILKAAENEFLARAHEAVGMQPTFQVVKQIGWFDKFFVTPSRVYPQPATIKGMPEGWSAIQVHLDAKDDDVHSRFRCHGSPLRSQELFRLCKGNRRFMFAAAFSFVGPICKPFGLRAPGVQFVGDAATAKTVAGIIAGATWGGVPDSDIGFGSAWNGTPNGLEDYAPAHHQTLMVLDETSLMPTDAKGRVLSFGEALMRLRQGQGKKRGNARVVERWSSPLISTSNCSVYALLDTERRKNWKAYADRLSDIPTPNGFSTFIENRHGFDDDDAFGQYLFDLATRNCGHPIHHFLERFTAELEADHIRLVGVVAGHVAAYKAASAGIASPIRNVQRARGYFATIYAAGCLAIRYRILPFTERELLDAILSCHRDHVAFVDCEVSGGTRWIAEGVNAQGPVMAERAATPVAGPTKPAELPFDRVRRFMNDGIRKRRFADATSLVNRLPNANIDGYVLRKNGKRHEFWVLPHRLKLAVGGDAPDREAKHELLRRSLIVTERRGSRWNFTVKRMTPDGKRSYFVVLRSRTSR